MSSYYEDLLLIAFPVRQERLL